MIFKNESLDFLDEITKLILTPPAPIARPKALLPDKQELFTRMCLAQQKKKST